MPSQAKKLIEPKTLCIRIDEKDGYAEVIQDVFKGDEFEAAIVVKHYGKDGRNPHYHAVCEAYYSKEVMRYRLNKRFDKGSGNGHMSIKEWDGNKKAIQYCLHECKEACDIEKRVVVNVGGRYKEHRWVMISWGELEQLRQMSIEIVDEIKDNSPGKICGSIAKHIVDNELDKRNTKLIWSLICKYLLKKGKWMISNKFQAERWVLQVKCEIAKMEDAKRGSEKSQDELIDEMYRNYFLSNY